MKQKRALGTIGLVVIVAILSLLVVRVVATESETYRVFFPMIFSPPPRKGVAGAVTTLHLADVAANWYHHWSLCKPIGTVTSVERYGISVELLADDNDRCVDVSKAFYFWELYDEGEEEIEDAMIACRSGWFMFGDEWELQNYGYEHNWTGYTEAWASWPMSKQIAQLRWYIEKRDEVNEDCKIAFGGILTYHPSAGGSIAPDWVPDFYDAYVEEYEEAPDIQAIVFDDYLWPDDSPDLYPPGKSQEYYTNLSVEAVYDTYGEDMEVWTRESGSLWSHGWALEAMDDLSTIAPYYDRIAWFIGRVPEEHMWEFCALWVDEVLTDLGRLYRMFAD